MPYCLPSFSHQPSLLLHVHRLIHIWSALGKNMLSAFSKIRNTRAIEAPQRRQDINLLASVAEIYSWGNGSSDIESNPRSQVQSQALCATTPTYTHHQDTPIKIYIGNLNPKVVLFIMLSLKIFFHFSTHNLFELHRLPWHYRSGNWGTEWLQKQMSQIVATVCDSLSYFRKKIRCNIKFWHSENPTTSNKSNNSIHKKATITGPESAKQLASR